MEGIWMDEVGVGKGRREVMGGGARDGLKGVMGTMEAWERSGGWAARGEWHWRVVGVGGKGGELWGEGRG